MAKVTGVVTKHDKNKYGGWSIVVDGNYYNSKFEIKCSVGDSVEFDDGGKNYCSKLKVLTKAAPTAAHLARFDQEIEAMCRPFEEAVVLLDTIPGVARQTAEIIVAEIGIDMSRFPTADHVASWAGVAPGNNESGGKRRSGKTRKGNRHLRVALVQAANATA